MLKAEDLVWICQDEDEPLRYKELNAEVQASRVNTMLAADGYYAMAEKYCSTVYFTLYKQFSINIIATIGYMDYMKEWVANFKNGPTVRYSDLCAVYVVMDAIKAMGGTDEAWTYPDSVSEN